MSLGSLGIIGGLAGTPLPQRAAETDKAQREVVDQDRTAEAAQRAEQAAGIGQTEEDSQASERDADGRRIWERPQRPKAKPAQPAPDEPAPESRSKDPTGACGGQLDLIG
jgi:hypothetical protein